jgi:tight adherence protein B
MWLAAGLIGFAMLVLATGSLAPARSRKEQRMAAIEQYIPASKVVSRSEGKTPATPITEQLIDLGERMAKNQPWSARVMALVERADLPLRLGEWVLLNAASGVVGGLLGYLVARSPLGVAIGLVLGAVTPPLVLRYLASRRANAFEHVLPDVLFLVASSLRSGFGLPQALDSVSRDAAEPAAKEFGRALAETRIGTDISDALDRMAERMGSTSMRWTVMALRIQRDVGGNLADTLTTTATTLREREALYRSVRALSAEGRLSAVILIIMPIIMFFYMYWANYEYISLLWTTPLGMLFVVGGIIGILVGIFWMSRVVKIEV